jgi:hypothetical protein
MGLFVVCLHGHCCLVSGGFFFCNQQNIGIRGVKSDGYVAPLLFFLSSFGYICDNELTQLAELAGLNMIGV